MAIITNLNELLSVANDMGGSYELGADIDLRGVDWIPFESEFRGTFNGNGHKIRNLTVNQSHTDEMIYGGLFAQLGNCTISNLVIEGANITVDGYNPHVGILAGRAYYTKPTLSNVSVQGEITVVHKYASEGGFPSVGGFIGMVYGSNTVSITDCISNVKITVTGCKRTLYVAGFIGYGRKLEMTRCFTFGEINVVNTEQSYISVSGMQSLCYYSEHINCASAVSIKGAVSGNVSSSCKYLTSTQEFEHTNSRRVWNGATFSYESYVSSSDTLASQADFIALIGDNSATYNTEDVDFANGKYIKLAIDTVSEEITPTYDITIKGETFSGVKQVIYNGEVIKTLVLNGTTYSF